MANGETLTAAAAAQDNPVGITEKYIYIIRNRINHKVYIGQAVDPEKRFRGHISKSSRHRNNSAIDSAIFKYGADNFYYEILEDKTSDYNERERYWIAFFNSVVPNGYNILPGGEEPPVLRGTRNNHSKFAEKDIVEIRKLLKNPSVTLDEIAAAYGVNSHTISNLNKGKTYHDSAVSYPIRDFQCSGEFGNMIPDADVDAIIDDILHSDMSLRQIGMAHGARDSQIASINEGRAIRYRRDGMSYPLRESPRLERDMVTRIQAALMRGDTPKKKIAEQFGVSYAVVSNINAGRQWRDPSLPYPLKPLDDHVHHFDESVWEEIRCRLYNRQPPREIARDMSLPNYTMVYDVNRGVIHRSDAYAYPIFPLS